MINKLIIIPNSSNDIKDLKNVGIEAFIFPLEKYSIGYNEYSIEELNSLDINKYLLINRILNTKEIDELIIDLLKINNIKGIFFEDLGVYEKLKDSKYELINYQTHFGTNYQSINCMLSTKMDSYVIANDLTYDEIKQIVDNVIKPVVLFIFGKSEVMYSRRKLLSNFKEFYNLDKTNNLIVEKVSKVNFDIKENNFGTYLFDANYYNGTDLLKINTNNVKYYLINALDVDIKMLLEIINLINNQNINLIKDLDPLINDGFLYQETIYRVKEVD